MLKKLVRAKYTPEFKHEAVRMVEAKGSIAGVARLEMEVDILKKAAAYFAKAAL